MCTHAEPCPSSDAVDREAAVTVASFPAQGWSLLCNGIIVFDDTGELMPDGSPIAPHRGPALHTSVTSRVTFGEGDPAPAVAVPIQPAPQHAMSR